MAIAVTLPVIAPTGLTYTLLSGGSLSANTTYYYVVIAYDQASFTPASVYAYHSPISAEGSFTTTSTNKSVKINWSNVAGATRYQILLTTISGNYTNSGGYGTTAESVGSITSGIVGYTITTLSSEIYVFHTCQIVNVLPGNLNKNLGLIKVDFNTAGSITLDQVYDAIVAQGFGDYVVYDGYTFTIKGFFYASAAASAGLFNPTRKRFNFIKGGVINQSNTYIMRFGTWTSDAIGANYTNGCAIDILNARTPFYGSFDKLQIYGSLVTNGQSMYLKLAENKTIGSFFYGTPSIMNNTAELKDSILGLPMRGNTSIAKDLKWSQQNNFGNAAHIRLKIYSLALLPYFQGGTFYDCKWLTFPTPLEFYNGAVGWSQGGYYTDFYDNEFVGYPDGMLDAPYFRYGSIVNPTTLTSNQYVNINYSVTATILDEQSNVLSGVTVTGVDKDNNPLVFIQHDTTVDKLVTGVKFTGTTTTDVNGQIDYYVKAYKINLNPANITYPTSTNIIKTNSYPIAITFSKAGFRPYTVMIEKLNRKIDMTLTLEDYEPQQPIISSVDIINPTINNNDGQITINVTNGTPPYTYSINFGEYQSSNIFSELSNGLYLVKVKDSYNEIIGKLLFLHN